MILSNDNVYTTCVMVPTFEDIDMTSNYGCAMLGLLTSLLL